MKITKKLREQAAMRCSMFAADRAVRYTDVSATESSLEWAAWIYVHSTRAHWGAGTACEESTLTWAEAEALLRTGFVPEGWS